MGVDVVGVEELAVDPVTAARRILGHELVATGPDGTVRARIVEVEAYGGPPDGRHPDPAAHGYRGPTPRCAVMFGRAGHLYVYRSYGIHLCVNVTCEVDGEGGAVLLRAAEIIAGHDLVAHRRTRPGSPTPHPDRWAMGPGNLGSALGVALADNAIDLCDGGNPIRLERGCDVPAHAQVESGPRVGLTVATGRPWRFWISGSPAVSAFRSGTAATRQRRLADRGPDTQGSEW